LVTNRDGSLQERLTYGAFCVQVFRAATRKEDPAEGGRVFTDAFQLIFLKCLVPYSTNKMT